jgi:uncharacterized protein GlcG (DUF336 family)
LSPYAVRPRRTGTTVARAANRSAARAAAGAPFGMPISYEQAVKAAEAAMAKAKAIGVPNAVAVVEPSGDLVYFGKMTGAPYSAIQLAQQKAVAAARYRRPTKAFFDAIEGGHPFFLTFSRGRRHAWRVAARGGRQARWRHWRQRRQRRSGYPSRGRGRGRAEVTCDTRRSEID